MRVKFNDLPRAVRERIVELSKAPQDPRVVIAEPEWAGGWFKYVTLIGGLGGAAFALNFLVERSRHGIAPYHDREVFMGLAAAMFVTLVSVASLLLGRVFPPPPYKTGTWALTSHLMRLSQGWVELKPLSELGKPTIVTVLRNGSYSGSRLQLDGGYQFHFSSKQSVDQACGKVLAAREVFAKALAAKDARTLGQIDPFSECTLSGQWTSPGGLDQNNGPKSPEVPMVARLVQWFGSLAASGGIAALAFTIFSSMHKRG